MGRHSYAIPTVHRYNGEACVVRVGHFASIGRDVEFLPGGNHHTDRVTTFPIRRVLKLDGIAADNVAPPGDVIVGNDVWIGRGARIVGSITIGDGAIVAAYSVVTKDVEPYAVVAGAPATFKRHRFTKDVQNGLLRVAWWNWTDEQIIERVDDLMSPDIEAFLLKYG